MRTAELDSHQSGTTFDPYPFAFLLPHGEGDEESVPGVPDPSEPSPGGPPDPVEPGQPLPGPGPEQPLPDPGPGEPRPVDPDHPLPTEPDPLPGRIPDGPANPYDATPDMRH